MSTVIDNTSDQDATTAHLETSLQEDDVKSHPAYKDLEKKYSAARTGMDSSNLTKKQLEAEVARLRVLAGESEEETVEEAPRTEFVTKEDLWNFQHESDIELYADEIYEKEVAQGVPRDTALQYAKLRYTREPSEAQLQRQQYNASGNTSVRKLTNIEITDKDREDMKKWGYSEATLLAHKKLRGQS